MTDQYIQVVAKELVKIYGDDAAYEAEFRAARLLILDDDSGYAIWRRVSAEVVHNASRDRAGAHSADICD
jgi:hypothetical protein